MPPGYDMRELQKRLSLPHARNQMRTVCSPAPNWLVARDDFIGVVVFEGERVLRS
jgi:hypothetical protein